MGSQREMIDKVPGMSLTELLAFILSTPHLLRDPTSPRSQKRWEREHGALDGGLRRDLDHDRVIHK